MGSHGARTGGGVLHWARAYDLLVWVLTRGKERQFRQQLLDLARLRPGESVLDVGCGTGTLAIAAKALVGPSGQVCGVDPSPEMVRRARRKAAKAGAEVSFENAGVEALPFPDGTFDAVLGTLMLHHVSEDARDRGLTEIARVLRPGGRFLAVDLGGGTHGKSHGLFLFLPIRRHAEFDLRELAPNLEDAGLDVVEQGPVEGPRIPGLRNLRFAVAARRAAA